MGKYELTPPEEMYIAVSHDLLTVADVGQATWEFWPNTDHGLQPPGGNPTIGEEPHVVPLTWGGYQVLMRTSQGYMGSVVSSIDPKLPWGTTQYARYAPLKGPSGAAANFSHIPELLPLPVGCLSADFQAGKHGGKQAPYRNGFTFDIWVTPATLPAKDIILFKTKAVGNQSIAVLARANGSLALELVDQNNVFVRWSTDCECTGALVGGGDVLHHVGVVADAGPNMILFTVDGKLCDGGRAKAWPSGWSLFDQAFSKPGALSNTLEILPGLVGENATKLVKGRVYGRALFVSELVGNYRAGPKQ